MVYVLFGPPGVGKSYIGELISRAEKYAFLDADTLIDAELGLKLSEGTYNQDDRDQFNERLRHEVMCLSETHRTVLVAEAFTKQKNREEFKQTFPECSFIFIASPKKLAEKRMIDRTMAGHHIIKDDNFKRFWDEFDVPELDHEVINNSGQSDAVLLKKFNDIKNL